jgi:hypothetical protein
MPFFEKMKIGMTHALDNVRVLATLITSIATGLTVNHLSATPGEYR